MSPAHEVLIRAGLSQANAEYVIALANLTESFLQQQEQIRSLTAISEALKQAHPVKTEHYDHIDNL